MENKGETEGLAEILNDPDMRAIAFKYLKKKGLIKFDRQSQEMILDSLKKPNKKTTDEIIEGLAKNKSKVIKEEHFRYYRYILEKMHYTSLYEKLIKEKGQDEAKKILADLIKKRFKFSKGYINEIKLLQKIYPKLIDKKIEREKTREKQKDWSKKDPPILITHEILKEFSDIMVPTSKNLSLIRTKVKRARERGFL